MSTLRKPATWEKFFWPILAAALLLAIWHYSVIWTATKVFPSPLSVEKGLVELVHKHVLWADIIDSLRRVAIGFGLAAIVGIPFGLALGWFPSLHQIFNPVLQILRPISPIAWIPVAIIFFGMETSPPPSWFFLAHSFPSLSRVPAAYRRCRRFTAAPAAISDFRPRKFW